MPLPRFSPAPLSRLKEPFDHPEWIFELKYDGFRALAYVDRQGCQLVSRNHHTFRTFPSLCQALAEVLRGRQAILDGEIVCLDRSGRPQFNPLLHRRQEPHFYAFDCLWLDAEDLRGLPLLERKRRLRALVPPQSCRLLYAAHRERSGTELFEAVCRQDLEGIVAKWAPAPYGAEPPSWIKIKNPAYSQAAGRREKFETFRDRAVSPSR